MYIMYTMHSFFPLQRLLPILQILDLSHNAIADTENHLEVSTFITTLLNYSTELLWYSGVLWPLYLVSGKYSCPPTCKIIIYGNV